MTKKDFELIASVIRNAPVGGFSQRAALTCNMANAIQAQTLRGGKQPANPNFNANWFYVACRNPNEATDVECFHADLKAKLDLYDLYNVSQD